MLATMATSSPAERRQRKTLGAFYSPLSLVEPMVAWAVLGADQSVLDPSCGDGIFLETAARRLRSLGASPKQAASLLHAIDVNPDAAKITRDRVTSELGLPFTNTRVANFFSLPPRGFLPDRPDGVDLVIGNPPYIRYQQFAGGARFEALKRAADAGVQLNRLASSWAHFVAHAATFIRPGGCLALILPAELIHTGYAAPLRQHLRRLFETLQIISFRHSVFPHAEVEVVLLLASGKNRGPGRLALAEADNCSDLADLPAILRGAEIFAPGEDPEKWSPGYTAQPGATAIGHLQNLGVLIPLGEVGKANIGFVTGANDFFVLTSEEAARWHLRDSSLQPAIMRARQIPGLQVTRAEITRLRFKGQRCLLWSPGKRLTSAERAYVARGEQLGYAERFKCRARTPWFRVPGVVIPDAFLTYMSDVIPRLCLNRVQVACSNTLLTVRLNRIPIRLRKAFVVAFNNSATLLSCERIGRSYGGGVLKLEPSEADRVLIPSADLVAQYQAPLMNLAVQVDLALRSGCEDLLNQTLSQIDAVLFERDPIARRQIALARELLRQRRQSRAFPRRDRSPTAECQTGHVGGHDTLSNRCLEDVASLNNQTPETA